MVESINDLDDILEIEASLAKVEAEAEADRQMEVVKREVSSNEKSIPEEIEGALFFLYMNGLSFDEIVKKYEKSSHPFTKRQLYRYSHNHKWAQKKEEILKEVKTDFSDMIKFSQAKKMTAVSMAVQAVSDMIIKDVDDLKRDPAVFWREVTEMLRPRPFWLARNVDELTGLLKLQKSLEDGLISDSGDGGIADADRAALLKALGEAAMVQSANITASLPDPKVIDVEVIPDVGSKQNK